MDKGYLDDRDMPGDRLDEARYVVVQNTGYSRVTIQTSFKLFKWLIKEVERLREIECCDVFIRHHGGSTLAETVLEDMEKDKQIESLTKELKELQDTLQCARAASSINRDAKEKLETEIESLRDGLKLEQLTLFEAQYKEKIDKLEAENADLRNTIQSQGEALRDREGNMDGLVQKLRKWLYKAEKENTELKSKLAASELEVKRWNGGFYDDSKCDPA